MALLGYSYHTLNITLFFVVVLEKATPKSPVGQQPRSGLTTTPLFFFHMKSEQRQLRRWGNLKKRPPTKKRFQNIAGFLWSFSRPGWPESRVPPAAAEDEVAPAAEVVVPEDGGDGVHDQLKGILHFNIIF